MQATIYPLSFKKGDLTLVPQNEVQLFLVSGQAANDVQILQRLLILALNALDQDRLSNLPALAQAMFLVRSLATRIGAAWESLERYPKLLNDAEAWLTKDGRFNDILEAGIQGRTTLANEMKNAKMPLRVIRNKIGAHMDVEQLDAAFGAVSDDTEFLDVLSPIHGNMVHGAADDIATRAVLGAVGGVNEAAITDLARLLLNCAAALTGVCACWSNYFYLRHLPTHFGTALGNGIAAPDPKDLMALSLPTFISDAPSAQ